MKLKIRSKILDFSVLCCVIIIVSVKVFHNDYMRTNWHWSIALLGTAFTMLCLFIEEEKEIPKKEFCETKYTPSDKRKTLITSTSGRDGMVIDFVDYDVEFFKSDKDGEYLNTQMIRYRNKKTNSWIHSNGFEIQFEDENGGEKMSFHFQDRWGSTMTFVHYPPSDLKGMFDFIAKGYGFYDKLISDERDS